MPIKISLADEPQEIDAVLKLRHTVFSEEEELFSATSDLRVMDRFDTFSTSKNLIAVSDGAVIGSMRLTLDSEAGIPADEYYDFRRLLPEDARILNCGMYCVTKPFRGAKIAIGLNLMASYFGVSNDVTHVVAPINPVIAKLVGRIG
ncbi:MAG: GNAT family N-acyltransferase, partial [Oceanospirillum sp.]|nr:GNAT family N-acyltransferase [Oceanospirillum sp.]